MVALNDDLTIFYRTTNATLLLQQFGECGDVFLRTNKTLHKCDIHKYSEMFKFVQTGLFTDAEVGEDIAENFVCGDFSTCYLC